MLLQTACSISAPVKDGLRSIFLQFPDGLTWVRKTANARFYRLTFELAFEFALIFVFLKAYNVIRNTFGSSTCTPEYALSHALQVIHVEEFVFIFWEQQIQALFLPFPVWIRFWNIFYGTAHMAATIAVLLYLFVAKPAAYQQWRTVFVVMNLLALTGYASYPLMPPRLVNECHDRYGGCRSEYAFVDTMHTIGGLWSWRNKDVSKVSNHYAAMPSMHAGYSIWCAWSMFRNLPLTWMRALVLFYPVLTIYCIVVTGNHYFLDAVFGGFALLAATKITVYLPRVGRGAVGGEEEEEDCAHDMLLPVVGVPYNSFVIPMKAHGQPDQQANPACSHTLTINAESQIGLVAVTMGGPAAHVSLVNLKNR